MLVRDLREGLGHLAALLSALQDKSAAADIGRFNELLRAHDELSVEAFCKRVEAALGSEQPARTAPRSSKPSSKDAPSNETVVAHYLNALRSSEADSEKGEATIAQLKSDKRVRKVEANAIADAFLGVVAKHKNKAEALNAVRQKLKQKASARMRLERIGEIF